MKFDEEGWIDNTDHQDIRDRVSRESRHDLDVKINTDDPGSEETIRRLTVARQIVFLSQQAPGSLDEALAFINRHHVKTTRDIVRIFRVLQYVGERRWVEETLRLSQHGTRSFSGKGVIFATTIGEFPEVVAHVPQDWDLAETFSQVDLAADSKQSGWENVDDGAEAATDIGEEE